MLMGTYSTPAMPLGMHTPALQCRQAQTQAGCSAWAASLFMPSWCIACTPGQCGRCMLVAGNLYTDRGCSVCSALGVHSQSNQWVIEDHGTHNYVRMRNRTVAPVSEKLARFPPKLLRFALPSSLRLACCLGSDNAQGNGLMSCHYVLTFRTIRRRLEHLQQTQPRTPGQQIKSPNTRCTYFACQ